MRTAVSKRPTLRRVRVRGKADEYPYQCTTCTLACLGRVGSRSKDSIWPPAPGSRHTPRRGAAATELGTSTQSTLPKFLVAGEPSHASGAAGVAVRACSVVQS